MLEVIKTEQSIYECLLVSVLTFSAPPQNLAASTVFLPNSRNEEMMGDGFPFGATAAGLFWKKTSAEHILQ